MTEVTDIKNSMKARIASVLGASFKELAYVENVDKNNWTQVQNGYGILPLEANEVPGVTKEITLDHNFEIVLTGQYNDSSINDVKIREKISGLKDLCLQIYKDLVNNQAGYPLKVMNVSNLFIEDAENNEESKVVYQRMQVIIKYRVSLI